MTDSERLAWLEAVVKGGGSYEVSISSGGVLLTIHESQRRIEYLRDSVRDAIDLAIERDREQAAAS